MPRYLHAIVIEIEADTFEASARIADDIVGLLGLAQARPLSLRPEGLSIDNDGQRVIYLTPEGVSEEEVE